MGNVIVIGTLEERLKNKIMDKSFDEALQTLNEVKDALRGTRYYGVVCGLIEEVEWERDLVACHPGLEPHFEDRVGIVKSAMELEGE